VPAKTREHLFIFDIVAMQIQQFVIDGGVFYFTLIDDQPCDFCFQNSFDLLLHSHLSLVTTLLLPLLLLNNLILLVLLNFLFMFSYLGNLAFMHLLALFQTNFNDLVSILIDLLVLFNKGLHFVEQPRQHLFLQLSLESSC
jgi:hypothetical protein